MMFRCTSEDPPTIVDDTVPRKKSVKSPPNGAARSWSTGWP